MVDIRRPVDTNVANVGVGVKSGKDEGEKGDDPSVGVKLVVSMKALGVPDGKDGAWLLFVGD